jgi:hypothetical protein
MLFSGPNNSLPGSKVRLFGEFFRWMLSLMRLEAASYQALCER